MATLKRRKVEQKFEDAEMQSIYELYAESTYTIRGWKTTRQFSLKDAQMFDPELAFVSGEDAEVIVKAASDGNLFLKIEIPLLGGAAKHYDLSWNNEISGKLLAGMKLAFDSLQLCLEESLNKKHLYVTGEISSNPSEDEEVVVVEK